MNLPLGLRLDSILQQEQENSRRKGNVPCCTGRIEIDYTEEMVLDNFIRGLSDEEIKSKVFAMQEEDCTPEKVLRFVEAEELGHSSV